MLVSEVNAPQNCLYMDSLDGMDGLPGKGGPMLVHTSDTYSDSFHCAVHRNRNSSPEHDHRISAYFDLLGHHRLNCSSEELQGFVVH